MILRKLNFIKFIYPSEVIMRSFSRSKLYYEFSCWGNRLFMFITLESYNHRAENVYFINPWLQVSRTSAFHLYLNFKILVMNKKYVYC